MIQLDLFDEKGAAPVINREAAQTGATRPPIFPAVVATPALGAADVVPIPANGILGKNGVAHPVTSSGPVRIG